jgi:hypothetical protein
LSLWERLYPGLMRSTQVKLNKIGVCENGLRHSHKRLFCYWWRRRESNPRPKIFSRRRLHAYPDICVSPQRTRSGTVPLRPTRLLFRVVPNRYGNSAILLIGASSTPTGKEQRDASLYAARAYSLLLASKFFHRRFNESPECSTCSLDLNYPRRNLYAPLLVGVPTTVHVGQRLRRSVPPVSRSSRGNRQPKPQYDRCRNLFMRSNSRRRSFFLMASRLSKVFLPRASASSTFTLPFLK